MFSSSLWLSLGLFVLLVIAFALYAWSERQVDRANEARHQSFVLADVLRQSSDDLTRMARTYVVTGDPAYNKYYQDILDIRDGKKARPEKYEDIYWDLVLADGKPPRPDSGQAIALLDLMRQAGITQQEFSKLAEAKADSDALAATAFEAMKLSESTGPDAESNRARALMMLYDDKFHQAKAAIMRPIQEFYELMDKRTLDAVHDAEIRATISRFLFIALGLGLVLALWRNYLVLRTTLGGGVDDVHMQIARIGGGD
ncbi:MAG: diguanylate cyclase, partial [Sulfurimicrobium sp.]|nr:diguanylate cyclase [Sulfurimicrobium sp.]